ncbi:U32 family peptidase [Candidatus Woesearchaeota archaeon]|nr:U32 family peptidase [Candidatus Woesearchaeota archaeon]
MYKIPEIMAPVGSFEALAAAIQAKADSVYFGIEQLNMRARSTNNFSIEDLHEIVKQCHKNNIKAYLTLNTILYDHDLALMHKICNEAKKAGVNAVIVADVAAMIYARSIGLAIHLSTQANITNIDAVKFYSQFADTVVLARELTLEQITKIVQQIKDQQIKGPSGKIVDVEVFVHGALCVAISGKCYMSLATYNASANRGACLQNCRRSYKITDEETGDELVVDNKYIMSPKDLCTIGFVDKLIESGVSIFKIEGRGKGPEYVFTTATVYKEAILAYQDKTYTPEKIATWTTRLSQVYNRGFWQGGYYLGKQLGEWSGSYGSQATHEKIYVGKVDNYYPKTQIAQVLLDAGELKVAETIFVTGPTTGIQEVTVSQLCIDEKNVVHAPKSSLVTFPCSSTVRKNDKVYRWKQRDICPR